MVLLQTNLRADGVADLLQSVRHVGLCVDVGAPPLRDLVSQLQTVAPDVLALSLVGALVILAIVGDEIARLGGGGAIGVLPALTQGDV